MLIAGIDAGGSKTECIIVDTEKDKIITRAQTGAANYQVVGLEAACREIKLALEQAKKRAGISCLKAVGIGLAGAGRREDLVKIEREMGKIMNSRNFFFSSDAHIALLGATGGSTGAVLIAGTGSIAYGLKKNGAKIRSGGWGPIIGDEGSGFWIGLEAAKKAVRAEEMRSEKTELKNLVLEHFNFSKLEELIPFIYQQQLPRQKIAALAPSVFDLAQNGDEAALKICQEAAAELAILAHSALLKLDYQEDKIAAAGGLIKSSYFYQLLKEKLRENYELEIYKAKKSAAYGAVFMALRELEN